MVDCYNASRYKYWARFTRFEVPPKDGVGVATVAFDIVWMHYCVEGAVCTTPKYPPRVCKEVVGGMCNGTTVWRYVVQPSNKWWDSDCGGKLQKWIKDHPQCRTDGGADDKTFDAGCWDAWAEYAAANFPECWPNVPFDGTPVEFPGNGKEHGAMEKMFPGMSKELNAWIEELIKMQGCKCKCFPIDSLDTNGGTSQPSELGELRGHPFQHTTFILPNGRTSK